MSVPPVLEFQHRDWSTIPVAASKAAAITPLNTRFIARSFSWHSRAAAVEALPIRVVCDPVLSCIYGGRVELDWVRPTPQ